MTIIVEAERKSSCEVVLAESGAVEHVRQREVGILVEHKADRRERRPQFPTVRRYRRTLMIGGRGLAVLVRAGHGEVDPPPKIEDSLRINCVRIVTARKNAASRRGISTHIRW